MESHAKGGVVVEYEMHSFCMVSARLILNNHFNNNVYARVYKVKHMMEIGRGEGVGGYDQPHKVIMGTPTFFYIRPC